jgi:hypothetical protein
MQNTIPAGPFIVWLVNINHYLQWLMLTDISDDSFPQN